jgi:CDP-glycerol glycerophosphotransferase
MSAVLASPVPSLDERVQTLEAFTAQVSQAIESLVGSVVGKSDDVAALQTRLREIEQQLALERALRDLERTSRLHPKARRVVFVGTIYFGDNVKYAWLAYRDAARAAGIDCWFLPNNAAQEAQVRAIDARCLPAQHTDWSAEHLHLALSAAVVVTSDHFLNPNPYAAALLAGARHVQLWHGVSIKEIGLRNLGPLKQMSPRFAKVLATCGPYARLVGTSAAAEPEWKRWFGFERYAPIGYPRNDVLLREATAHDLVNVDAEALALARRTRDSGRRVIFYAPTFRDANRARWVLDAGLARIAKQVAAQGDALIVNLHPVEQPHIGELRPALPGVTFVAPCTDAYPLLRECDALVTDYSSLMFDWLLLDRPVLLFRPDHRDYTERSRTLFDAKLDPLPGPVASDAAALLALFAPRDFGAARFATARAALRNALYDHHDAGSGARFAALVDELLAATPTEDAA